MKYTEKEYNELYKYSLNIASKYIGYKDSAYDIAQNAILSLISAKAEITSPFSWIRTTVKREAIKFIAQEKKETESIQQSRIEILSTPSNIKDDDTDDFCKLSSQKIKRILTPSDFELYLKFKACGFSGVKFAKKVKMSINSVKSFKNRIKLNIISAYLLEEGWQRGIKLLNYNQYVSINRFVTQIIDCVKEQKLSEMRNYLQKIDNSIIQELFKGVDKCIEWNIAYINDIYKLLMVCTPIAPMPKVIEVSLKFHKSRYIYIIEAIEKKPTLVVKKSADEVRRYKVNEKINLSDDQLVSILTDKQTKI